MVKIIENKRLVSEGDSNVIFLRIAPEDLSITIRDIIEQLQNLSWINNFDERYLREAFSIRSFATVDYLKKKL
ncbi:hypothetical protein K6V78_10750 [Streptococcus gallolyticus]|uniref:hypothetical protein n=1 Tax=Streptococcus hepaticus TaxID=3349163 RepID=UPI001C988C00|nr:hypothetical protein [Streptococcus gallolyticus]MBY5042039.1 hypothetical protein [Streptococcus gallolyticus]